MQIIPVIDIRKGQVVHATGGNRQFYPPLTSVMTEATSAQQVLKDMLAWLPFKQIYIADLDAIESGRQNHDLYAELIEIAGDAEIWLDAGVHTDDDITKCSPRLKWVLGSETLIGLSVLRQKDNRHDLILSLDHKQGSFLGYSELVNDCSLWPQHVIVMNLDRVGAKKGPALEQLKEFILQRPDCHWFAAGGVRNEKDLQELELCGAAGVLIASALHSGELDKQCARRFMT